MLGVGFDAHVVHNLPFPLKKVFGKGAYVMQSMRELVRYKFPAIRMRIDDTETEAASVIISKGRLYGGRFRLAADAVPGRSGVFGGAVRPVRPWRRHDVWRRAAVEPARPRPRRAPHPRAAHRLPAE